MADDMFGVFDDGDTGPRPLPESELTPVTAVFLRKLRERTYLWRQAGVDPDDVFTAYADGRLWVVVSITDPDEGIELTAVRAEVDDKRWRAARVGLSDAHRFEDADPRGQVVEGVIADPEADLEGPITWLRTQLSSPIEKYAWHEGGELVAELWRVRDTGESLVASGDPAYRENLASATEVRRVR